jgi:thiol-disulfide isomerase/thioredoxin
MPGAPALPLLLALALRAGDAAPAVELVDLTGRPVSLEPNGQVVIVDFFATWCPSCRRSLADYRGLVAALGARARIVLVDVREPAAVTRAFFASAPLPAGVVLARDPRGQAMRSFGATSFPSFYVIDPGGTVRGRGHGWGEGAAPYLVKVVRRILDGPAPAAPPVHGTARRGSTTEISADERARRMGVEIVH